MSTLYNLVGEYRSLQQIIEDGEHENDDEMVVALDAALHQLEGELQDKVLNCALVYKSLKAEADVIGAEMKRLAQRRASRSNAADRLAEYLHQEMKAAQMLKVQNPLATISIRTNNASVEVLDEEAVPTEWHRIIPERREVDKQAILTAWREDKGLEVAGTRIITDKTRLEIR